MVVDKGITLVAQQDKKTLVMDYSFSVSAISEYGLQTHGDERGSLIAIENFSEVPFAIARAYYIFGTQQGVARGFHAHKRLQQLLVCVAGSCTLRLESKTEQRNLVLNSPTKAVLLQGLVWREMYDFSADCVLLVLADQVYSEQDCIRNYAEFKVQLNLLVSKTSESLI